MDIVIKGNAQAPGRPADVAPNEIWVDHETGLIHGMPGGPQEMVGPTTGKEYQELKKNERAHRQAMHLLKRQILSTYQCVQCKQKYKGSAVRLSWETQEGVQVELLRCPSPKCNAPVVMIEDALNLTRPPMGKI